MEEYLWIPGQGIDLTALQTMRSQFPKPSTPMGEAWFMGEERRMFSELLGDVNGISVFDLQTPLTEIASGFSCFGPLEEWSDWYHYLLAALLPRAHENFVNSLLELLVTDFMTIYPSGITHEPYNGFRNDVLLTLGRCMMNAECWNDQDIAVGRILHRSNNNPNRVWMWWDASGDLSASMFFCLKYLPSQRVGPWLESVLAITSAHWRAQVMAWAVGANDILNARIGWPSEFPETAYPAIAWEYSHCLRPEITTLERNDPAPAQTLIPDESRVQALEVLCSHFDEDRYLEWLSSIAAVSYLEDELGQIPDDFQNLFVGTIKN
jgi:hypothetical protein